MYFQTAENANDRAVPETDLFCQRIQRRSSSNSKSISKARVRSRAPLTCMRGMEQFLPSSFFSARNVSVSEQRRTRYARSYYVYRSMFQMNPQSVIGISSSPKIHHRITNDVALANMLRMIPRICQWMPDSLYVMCKVISR